MKQTVQELLSASGVDLTNGGGFKEVELFQNYLSDYKIIVYDVLSTDRILFIGISLPKKKLYLLYFTTTMLLRTSRLQWQKDIYVTRVTSCLTLHTNATEFAPYVQRHHPVPKIGKSIVLLGTSGS